MLDWEEIHDGVERFSFYDSDRFEEDSLCSWNSEPEPVCNNWRGWKRPSTFHSLTNGSNNGGSHAQGGSPVVISSLVELAAKQVASHIPFEVVERFHIPVPEPLQLRITFWSFPENEDDIRLYSCLANGNPDEFVRGETLYRNKAVSQSLQIGFHLSANVTIPGSSVVLPSGSATGTGSAGNTTRESTRGTEKTNGGSNTFHVAITFDRRRIVSCTCTCNGAASWCSHVVAVCLHRIHQVSQVKLRAPVSESLSRLRRDQLQKFAQYLISELPQQILPTAQRLLDDLLSAQLSPINTVCGAPDPTAGASAGEQTAWCFNEAALHDNIRKTLIKFCVPSPIVFSDVNYLSSTAPPAAAEWTSLLRPLRGREPEGMWNLLSIVREMFRRHDRNAIPLLQVLTEECLACEQILVWWFNTKVALHTGSSAHNGRSNNVNNNAHASQHATSSLCDEIVALWRLAALNPALPPSSRDILLERFKTWHIEVIQRVQKSRANNANSAHHGGNGGGNAAGNNNSGQRPFVSRTDIEAFNGFKPAIEACSLTWDDYPILGVTFSFDGLFDGDHTACLISSDSPHGGRQSAINSSQAVLNCQVMRTVSGTGSEAGAAGVAKKSSVFSPMAGNRCSVSSEGFCENLNVDDAQQGNDDEIESDLSTSPGSQVRALVLQMSRDREEADADAEAELDAEAERACAAPKPEAGAMATVASSSSSSSSSSLCFVAPSSDTKAKPEGEKPAAGAGSHSISPSSQSGHLRDESGYFVHLKRLDDPLEVLFARAEALHAHGFSSEASTLAIQLAEELLARPPDLMVDFPPPPMTKHKRRRCRVNPVSHQTSCLASATLSKASFLCSVLSDIPELQSLAFRVGLFGLELARPPASTKALEVKMANQELELVSWLKKIPLGQTELDIIREKAIQLRDGTLRSRGDALLPLNLASYILDALVLSSTMATQASVTVQPPSSTPTSSPLSTPSSSVSKAESMMQRAITDKQLGFAAAVAALGLKANVSEAEHPLLCEGTRRQRGDLALTLLVHYKDDQNKLACIMDKLLDRQVHQMYKAPPLSSYYATNVPNAGSSGATAEAPLRDNQASQRVDSRERNDVAGSLAGAMVYLAVDVNEGGQEAQGIDAYEACAVGGEANRGTGARPKDYVRYPAKERSGSLGGDRKSPTWAESDCDKQWEAKFRCANLRTCFSKKSSNPMASIDSSAPETTSSDNSPTVVRRAWKMQGPGSDSGSSGKSSDSLGSSSSGGEKNKQKRPSGNQGNLASPSLGASAGPALLPDLSPASGQAGSTTPTNVNQSNGPCASPNAVSNGAALMAGPPPPLGSHVVGFFSQSPLLNPSLVGKDQSNNAAIRNNQNSGASGTPGASNSAGANVNGNKNATASANVTTNAMMTQGGKNRFKSKRAYPTIPNQPSEAGAHFMFELAKTVLAKAGGNSSTSLFTETSASGNHRGPHRALHMCAFQIGLYALGLHNCVSPNWLSRTYSSHVSWISGQALEIGECAIAFLMKTWEGHLTPPEVANLADRASRTRDPGLVRVAAELALSVLPHAHALNPNEIQTAITQCKDHSDELLERACLAVETAAKGGGVSPDVLFKVARRWQDLYLMMQRKVGEGNGCSFVSRSNGEECDVGRYDDPRGRSPGMCEADYSMSAQNPAHPVVESIQVDLAMPTGPLPGVQPLSGPNNCHAAQPGLPNAGPSHPPLHAYSFQVGLATPYQTYASFTYLPPLATYSSLAYPLNLSYQGLHSTHHGTQPSVHHHHHHFQHAHAQALLAQQAPLIPHHPGAPPTPHNPLHPLRHQLPNGGYGGSHGSLLRHPGPPTSVGLAMPMTGSASIAVSAPLCMTPVAGQPGTTTPPSSSQHNQGNQFAEYDYRLNAYRVGMLAMETLATRVHDDRPQAKYAPNPPYADDVKWLLKLAIELGSAYIHRFCLSAVHSVVSPFVLVDLSLEAASYLSRQSTGNGAGVSCIGVNIGAGALGTSGANNSNGAMSVQSLAHHLRSPMLSPLVQRCQQMFIQCTHQRLYHITPGEYEDFVSIVRTARTAFQMTLGGPTQFQELLQSLKRSKFCKKELWHRITAVLQQSPGH
ncbi:unnamed protein product [Notodromas monacha]|uniref:SWIM-type domain-containing protein n=1 Tax=Notodromas monacha TaxID=399045 RepID=A0A7R9BKD5_9CRUS|nr:unnamed protein product [Notodromas monacha]CAG0915760.1 unnamed protein product [Notodromas monacha]